MSAPNIVFVFADQLRYGALGCSGNAVVRTPNFDRLARDGVVFDQAFSSCPICSPYRGQILTGRYAHANGVVCNEYALFEGQRTIAHALRDAGYWTGYVGKWHLGHGPFTEEERHGFDDLLAYNCDHNYYDITYRHNESAPQRMEGYAPDVETELALGLLRRRVSRDPDRPFCLFLSWGPPHWDFKRREGRDYSQYPEEFRVYDPRDVPVPPNVPMQFRDFAAREIADYYGMVTSLDACMGRLLEALDSLGVAENTILCFSSDHGDHLSAHGYGKPMDGWMHPTMTASKATPHEESVHIPFILRYPCRVSGRRRSETILNSVDVLPTLLGLCGIAPPRDVQGRDLSYAALGTNGAEPDSAFLQILGPGWPNRAKWVGLWRGVRTREYTYARWHDRGRRRVLYDLRKAPHEMRNLVQDPAYAAVADGLEQRLQQWLRDTEDPFDTGERLPVTEMLDLGQRFTSRRMHELAPQAYAQRLTPPRAPRPS